MESQVVMITGASGFLGSHVTEHFLNAGYTVKALCREAKATELKRRSDNPRLRVIAFKNLTCDDFSSVLQGVHAIVHVASPTPFYSDHVEVAVKGSLNIFIQAYAAGVRKFIFISSIYSVVSDHSEFFDSTRVFDHNSWGTTPVSLYEESARYLKELLPQPYWQERTVLVPSSPISPTKQRFRLHRICRFFSSLFKLHRNRIPDKIKLKSIAGEEVGQDQNDDKRSCNKEPEKTIDPFQAYAASKLLAEEAVWSFAETYQDADIISILPSYFYGPFSKFHIIREPTTLSTNYILYGLFARPQASYPPEGIPDHVVDVRDVAKACVLAMSAIKPISTPTPIPLSPSPSSSPLPLSPLPSPSPFIRSFSPSIYTNPSSPRRRILLSSGVFSWDEVSAEIARVYPDLKDRVVGNELGELKVPPPPKRGAARIDVSMANQVLGMNEFIPWQTSVKDAVACLLETEDRWNPCPDS